MADLNSLVKELKSLNARKKAGEDLSASDDERRKRLKRYLRAALEKEQGAGLVSNEGTAIDGRLASALKSDEKPAASRGFAVDAGDLLAKAAASTGGPAEELFNHEVDSPELLIDEPAPAPAPAPAPPKKDYSKAFALDASSLLEAAAASDAVAAAAATAKVPGPGSKDAPGGAPSVKLSPTEFETWLQGTSTKGMRNSAAAIEQVASEADRALQQNKTRERVFDPEQVKEQLADILGQSGYTPPEHQLALEQYYGEYVEGDGLAMVTDDYDFGLSVIDPLEIDLYRSGMLGEDAENEPAPVPNGLAFLDDFPALYEMGVLPPASEEVVFDVNDPNLLIPGKRKVTVHLLNGQVKRGAIRSLARDDAGFRLEPAGIGRAEDIPVQHCKAIFVHKSAKSTDAEPTGPVLTVMFKDRRSVQGTSDDYQPGAPLFSLVPPQQRGTQGQFERIIVNAGAVKQVR
jgi:hypothetical protein